MNTKLNAVSHKKWLAAFFIILSVTIKPYENNQALNTRTQDTIALTIEAIKRSPYPKRLGRNILDHIKTKIKSIEKKCKKDSHFTHVFCNMKKQLEQQQAAIQAFVNTLQKK